MKRIVILILITFFVCSHAKSEELKWYSWNEGYELAKKQNKPMLIFVYASWCNMCKRLEEKTFKNEEVIPLINNNFVPVKLDPAAKEDYLLGDAKVSTGKLLNSISVETSKGLSVPTTVIWNAGSRKSKVITGLLDPDEMKKILSAKYKKR